MSEDVTTSKIVKAYIKIRDKRKELKEAFSAEDKALEEKQDVLSQALVELCKQGDTSMLKTDYGTVTKTVKTRYWTSDWSSMMSFIKEHQQPELLEQRIHQTNFKEFIKANPELIPKGLNVESKFDVVVRRATPKTGE